MDESANTLSHFEHFTKDLLSAVVHPSDESNSKDGEMVVFDEKPSGSGPDHPVNTFIALTECSTIEDLSPGVL